MDAQKVDMFIMSNSQYFDSSDLAAIRQRLLELDDSQWASLTMLQFKNPTTMLIISFLGGGLGIDRFMLGDTGKGIGKLVTCGGLGIWALVDLFMISGATREKNRQKIREALNI